MPETTVLPIWMAFDPIQMEYLLAHVKNYQHVMRPKWVNNHQGDLENRGYEVVPLPIIHEEEISTFTRPLAPMERFYEAVKIFRLIKKVKFSNCNYIERDNCIQAIGRMDEKRAALSEKLFKALLDWDEKILDRCVSGPSFIPGRLKTGGQVNEELGFGKHPAPGFDMEISIDRDIDADSGDSYPSLNSSAEIETESTAQVDESINENIAQPPSNESPQTLTQPVKRPRGRPKKSNKPIR